MLADINQTMIMDGIRRNSRCCPVALAIAPLIPSHCIVFVMEEGIRVFDQKTRRINYHRHTTESVKFIRDFDAKGPDGVRPTKMTIPKKHHSRDVDKSRLFYRTMYGIS